jgi:hypothetical protein
MATTLLVGEQAHGHLKKATANAFSAAQKVGAPIEGVVLGP